LLPTIIGDKEVSGSPHFDGMFRYLTQFKMGDSAVDSHVANAIEELATFTVTAPRSKQFANAVALLSFPKAAAWTV
jgi:hypothetical protein